MFGIKSKIIKFIRKSFQLDGKLTQIRISPMGYICNHRCPMCWRTNLTNSERNKFICSEKNHLSMKEYVNILKNIPRSVHSIEVEGGGEPLLYPKIRELLILIKNKNLYSRLITNGSVLNRKICQVLINSYWDEVRISIHAGSSNVYKLVNGKDDFDLVLRNIKFLINLREKNKVPRIKLFFVIQHDNVNDIHPFIQQAMKLKVDEIEFDSLIPFTPKKLLLTNNDREKVIATLKNIQTWITMRNNINNVIRMFSLHNKWNGNIHSLDYFKDKYCQIVQSNIDIHSNGITVPCCLYPNHMSKFDIRNGSVQEAWDYYRSFRKNLALGKFYDFCYRLCNYNLEYR